MARPLRGHAAEVRPHGRQARDVNLAATFRSFKRRCSDVPSAPMALVLVRHALAVARTAWDSDDNRRPLTPRGDRQARTLVDVLREQPTDLIVSSPTLRCKATVRPVADAAGVKVKTSRSLREGHGSEAIDLVLDAVDDIVLCTHGDIVEYVLGALRQLGWPIPPRPHKAKGSAWVLTRSRCEYLPPGA